MIQLFVTVANESLGIQVCFTKMERLRLHGSVVICSVPSRWVLINLFKLAWWATIMWVSQDFICWLGFLGVGDSVSQINPVSDNVSEIVKCKHVLKRSLSDSGYLLEEAYLFLHGTGNVVDIACKKHAENEKLNDHTSYTHDKRGLSRALLVNTYWRRYLEYDQKMWWCKINLKVRTQWVYPISIPLKSNNPTFSLAILNLIPQINCALLLL
jgi:hypothetical protein